MSEPNIHMSSDDWNKLKHLVDLSAENASLKAEVERLTELVESNLNSSKVAMSKADTVLHERDRLKAEVERLKIYDYKNLSMRIEIDKLNAKINRLVKAGDKMVLCIDGDYNYQMPCVQAWNAAKEGKPSV